MGSITEIYSVACMYKWFGRLAVHQSASRSKLIVSLLIILDASLARSSPRFDPSVTRWSRQAQPRPARRAQTRPSVYQLSLIVAAPRLSSKYMYATSSSINGHHHYAVNFRGFPRCSDAAQGRTVGVIQHQHTPRD